MLEENIEAVIDAAPQRGRKPAAEKSEAPEAVIDAAPKFALAKNFGGRIGGNPHTFYPAGTEFDPVADKVVIGELAQRGAIFAAES